MSSYAFRVRSTASGARSVRLEDRGLGPVRPLRVVLVAGAGRSGSTLLTLLLGSLPDTFAVGELRYLWQRGVVEHRLCGCGKPLTDCPLWQTILHKTFDGDVPANIDDAIDAVDWIGSAANLPSILRRPSSIPPIGDLPLLLSRLYRAVAEITGAHTIIDSSKPPTYGWLVGTLPGIELSVIHLVRDPRGTAFSWLHPKAAVDRPTGGVMPRKPPWKSTLNWGVWNMATELLFRGRPDRLLRVRYEDLVAEPEATLASVLAFLGHAEHSLDALDGRSFRRSVSHTVAGNPSRLTNEPTTLRRDLAWEAELPTTSRRVVTALAAPLLHHYGYRIRHRPGQTAAGGDRPSHLRRRAKATRDRIRSVP
jgi:hypothetical protein